MVLGVTSPFFPGILLSRTPKTPKNREANRSSFGTFLVLKGTAEPQQKCSPHGEKSHTSRCLLATPETHGGVTRLRVVSRLLGEPVGLGSGRGLDGPGHDGALQDAGVPAGLLRLRPPEFEGQSWIC